MKILNNQLSFCCLLLLTNESHFLSFATNKPLTSKEQWEATSLINKWDMFFFFSTFAALPAPSLYKSRKVPYTHTTHTRTHTYTHYTHGCFRLAITHTHTHTSSSNIQRGWRRTFPSVLYWNHFKVVSNRVN